MNRKPPQALLYVPPAMTKTEVKEYLTKIYGVNVLAVMTANFLGKIIFLSSLYWKILVYLSYHVG